MKIVSLATLPKTTTSHNSAGEKRNMIPPGKIPTLAQFSQVSFRPDEIATEHKHDDMYEVFFVENGVGAIKINGKQYPLEKGTCVTVEPRELHEVTNTGSEDLVLTYFGIEEKGR
jgi:mannose-6-phosphate isomerase-like protein (cupin superfamily)